MSRVRYLALAVALAGILSAAPAMAQSSTPPEKPAATKSVKRGDGMMQKARKEWDGISTMTGRQWNAMKGRWSREKQKWGTCNKEARAQKLSMASRWTYVGKCMTK